MLSNWKKSASADRAQSKGSNHRTDIEEEDGARRSKGGWTRRPDLTFSHLSEAGSLLEACSVWGTHPSAHGGEQGRSFCPQDSAWRSFSPAPSLMGSP